MARTVPARFKRVVDAFNEAAMTLRARPLYGSSDNEHSAAAAAESLTDLSGLVNSFMEKNMWEGNDGDDVVEPPKDEEKYSYDVIGEDDVVEAKDALERLLSYVNYDVTKRNLYDEVEEVRRDSGVHSSPDFKRHLMARLRNKGFDAGVCKSRWEKNGGCPRGEYEYIDVNINDTRYIIEVSLRGEFEIVRPTASYTSLLENFLPVFVGKAEELKKIVRIMSNAMKKSMKKMGIHVPPWRRLAYMQAKWFSSYKRTTNEIPTAQKAATSSSSSSSSSSLHKHIRSVGFAPRPEVSLKCRVEDFGVNNGFRIGNLGAALSGS